MKTYFCLFVLLGLTGLSWSQAEPDTTEVDRLVALFEHQNFKIRTQAEKDLSALIEADPHLLLHLSTLDAADRPETHFRLKNILKPLRGEKKLTLVDALRLPIPNAVLAVYRPAYPPFYHQKDAVFIGHTFTDAEGVFHVPRTIDNLGLPPPPPRVPGFGYGAKLHLQFEVFARGYGVAGVRWPVFGPERNLNIVEVPLVHEHSEAAAKAVTGTVKDDAGQPLRRAVVNATMVQVRSVDGIQHLAGRALTDVDGRFRLYRVPDPQAVPLPGSNMIMKVDGDGLFPISKVVPRGIPVELVVPRPTLKRRFSLEDDNKPEAAWLKHRTGGEGGTLVPVDTSLFADAGMIVPGRYQTGVTGWDVAYHELQVDASSPEVLTFKRKRDQVLAGKILDGVTDNGTEAVIFGYSKYRGEGALIDLSDADLQEMLDTEDENLNTTQGYAKIAKTMAIVCIGTSDKNGRYRMVGKGRNVREVIALAPGMLPVRTDAKQRPDKAAEPDADQLLPMRLFPAAKLRLEAVLPAGFEPEKPVMFWPLFEAVSNQEMPWFERFVLTTRDAHGRNGFRPAQYRVPVGQEQLFYVPANLDFRMQFTPPSSESLAPLIFDEPMRLKPGELHDLGRHVMRRTELVKVRVVDPAGKPLEDVLVVPRYDRAIGQPILHGDLTDKQGLAEVRVSLGMKGAFKVLVRGPSGVDPANLSTSFLLDRPTDEVYEIRMKREQIPFLPN